MFIVRSPVTSGEHVTGATGRDDFTEKTIALSITEKTVGSFTYEHLSNTAGDALLVAIKRPDFCAEGKKWNAMRQRFLLVNSTTYLQTSQILPRR